MVFLADADFLHALHADGQYRHIQVHEMVLFQDDQDRRSWGQMLVLLRNQYEEIEEEGTDFKEVVSAETDSSSGAGGKRTPSTGSVDDDFELLDKSVEDVSASKATGSQPQAKSGKSNKRKSKKR